MKPPTTASHVFQSDDLIRELNRVFLIGIQQELDEIKSLLAREGFALTLFGDGAAFMAADYPDQIGCIVIEQSIEDASASGVVAHAQAAGARLTTIVVAQGEQVRLAVQALRAGAHDVLQKPVAPEQIRDAVLSALAALRTRPALAQMLERLAARKALAGLTDRQRDILQRIVEGQSNKVIAADMGVSQRTIENQRATIMKRLGVSSASALIRIILAAR